MTTTRARRQRSKSRREQDEPSTPTRPNPTDGPHSATPPSSPRTPAASNPAQSQRKPKPRSESRPNRQPQPQASTANPSSPPNSNELPALSSDVIFQCGNCRTVISDSLGGYHAFLETNTILLTTALNVSLHDTLNMSTSGPDAGCTFKILHCDTCSSPLGKVYSSTTPALDSHRHTYTFDTASLISYQLGSARTLDGKHVNAAKPDPNLAAHQTVSADLATHNKASVPFAAFDALDAHVTTLTDATNRLNAAFEQNRLAIEQTRSHFNANISELRSGLEHAQNMMLLWEERFQRLQSCEQQLKALPRSENRLNLCESRLSRIEAAFRGIPPSSPSSHPPPAPQPQPHTQSRTQSRTPARVKMSPGIRKPGPSPAGTPMRALGSPQRTVVRRGRSPVRGPLRTLSSPAVTPVKALPQRRL